MSSAVVSPPPVSPSDSTTRNPTAAATTTTTSSVPRLAEVLRHTRVRFVENDTRTGVTLIPIESNALQGSHVRVSLQQQTLRDGTQACVIRAVWGRRRVFSPNDLELCVVLANANSRVHESTGGGGGGAFYRDAFTGELGYRVVHVNSWWADVWKRPSSTSATAPPTAANPLVLAEAVASASGTAHDASSGGAAAPLHTLTPMQQRAVDMLWTDVALCLRIVEEWAPLIDRAVFASSSSSSTTDPPPKSTPSAVASGDETLPSSSTAVQTMSVGGGAS